MIDNQDLEAVFTKPTVPKNSWQVFCWIFFEPKLLKEYSNNLNLKQSLWIQLKTYPFIILLSCLLYLFSCLSIAVINSNSLISVPVNIDFFNIYKELTLFFKSIIIVINDTLIQFIIKLIIGLSFGVSFGIGGLFVGLVFGLIFTISGGLVFDIAFELTFAIAVGASFGINFYLKIIFYPLYYTLKKIFKLSDATEKLSREAFEEPQNTFKIINFLRHYRSMQAISQQEIFLHDMLADKLTHAAVAGSWSHQPLEFKVLKKPFIQNKKFRTSDTWTKELYTLKQQLISYRQQTQISLKKQSFQKFIKQLDNFKQQIEIEKTSWNKYYLRAIKLWQEEAEKELTNIEIQLKNNEPITANIYLWGDALNPQQNQDIFLGRNDLQEQFSFKIQTSATMPLFLIQGQRRTGKTSLLNFLEQLLGTGFKLVRQDLQDINLDSIPNWLDDLQQQISQSLEIPTPEKQTHENWLQQWKALQNWFIEISQDIDYKLILAFDEYEAIHTLLQEDEKQGSRLLAAMRSFSQQQNKIVFLFIGAALFSELEKPNWSEYFVQVQRFKVDYLKREDALKLITDPVKLDYPPEVTEQMYQLTQGHPALLQLMCSKMVMLANSEGRKQMSQTDLDNIVNEITHEREILAIHIFWTQFCAEQTCKDTVLQIINKQVVSNKKQQYRLEEHGYIIEKNGQWQIRVPLFERWLRYFSERI